MENRIIRQLTELAVAWQTVLGSPNFYPQLNLAERRTKLGQASMRLQRWFKINDE